jgi:hypothetical protein
MGGDEEKIGESLLIESTELSARQAHRVGLNGHMCHCLAEVIHRKFTVIPIRVLNMYVANVDDEQARLCSPRPRTAGKKVKDLVPLLLAATNGVKSPGLGVSR